MFWAKSAPLVEIGITELQKTGRVMFLGPPGPLGSDSPVVKRQEDGRKNPFVAHFKPAKKNLSSHFEWMDTSTRPSLREEMRNKERKMEFTTLHLLARK